MKIAVIAILGLIALTGVFAISSESYGRSFAATRTVPATKTAGDLDTAFRFAQVNAQGHIYGAPATKVVMNGGKNVKNKAGSPDAAGQDAANGVDLRSIVRECPKRQCGANSTCPNPGGTCCGTDDNYCCPMGSTCLTTKPPTCIQDAPDDPFRCAEDDCMPGYHCPHANVTKCCLGGTSCCAAGLQCRATNPPTCVPEDKRSEETKAKEEHDKKSESGKEDKKELKFLGYDKKHHGGKAAGGNLAKAATAFTNSNEVGGHPISKINDGTYGDSSSFYCSIDSNAFLGVSWSSDQTIRTVCFSRDNTGARKDRASGEYTLQYASVAGSAETPEAQWKTIASMKLKAHRNAPEKRHCFRFSADFVARSLRLKSSRAAFACDEFEAYGTDLAEWWN